MFIADSSDQKLLTIAIQKGQQLLFIECSKCYKDVPINPIDLMLVQSQIYNSTKEEYDGQNCTICSDGIISFIENKDEKFWGCGFRVSLPSPKVIDKITKEELTELVRRQKTFVIQDEQDETLKAQFPNKGLPK
ncbi:hypothetical protein [Polluticaenibacter yanchengensis]|uniref:Uncharacterized protein n=1 Tax=Polluticaenibacter yanchengensis TaxID=3014562 RepID=A0ABT4UPR7_9BACT|nr:hypothetical protein [Chitinophagaceae bacterium LY-5]